MENKGYIYIMSIDGMPGLYKVGASNNPEKRAKALTKSSPHKRNFSVKKSWEVPNYFSVESNVLRIVASNRIALNSEYIYLRQDEEKIMFSKINSICLDAKYDSFF